MKPFEPRVELDANGYPVFIEPLKASDLANFSAKSATDVAQMHRMMALYGLEDPRQNRQAIQQYLSRFNIVPSSPRYQAEFDRLLTEAGGNRVLLATARRTSERVQTNEAVKGDRAQKFVYVNEGPADTLCDGCRPLNGEGPHIYQWFAVNDHLPGDQCYGGDNCLCNLVPVS